MVEKSSSRSNRKQPDASLILGELIGEKARVAQSSCKGLQGIEGIVEDESLNSFVFRTARGAKRIPKKGSVFVFAGLEVPGEVLLIRPEDRTKKASKTKSWKKWIAKTRTAPCTAL